VKVVRSSKENLVVELNRREQLLLLKLLEAYPLVPSSYQQLSRRGELKDQQANQRLLDEAMAENRKENREHLQAFLKDPDTFEQGQNGCCMHLSQGDLDWLLQILNDIRVGSWIALGSPEEKPLKMNPETAPQYWVMEIAGFLEAALLNAWEADAGF
jgi:hypothetical protein